MTDCSCKYCETDEHEGEPDLNEDRDGVLVYLGDGIEEVADDGTLKRRGVVTSHPRDGRVMVRWNYAPNDVAVWCREIVVVP